MTAPTDTRRPTAKQREFMMTALNSGSLSAPTNGLQQRTVDAMVADGWIVKIDQRTAALTLQGAAAMHKRIEFVNEQDRIANLTPPPAPTLTEPVDPAPGTLADLLGLVDLYATEKVDAALSALNGRLDVHTAAAESREHAALAEQHREQIERIARKFTDAIAEAGRATYGARVVEYPDAGEHNRALSAAMNALEHRSSINGTNATATERNALVYVVEQISRAAYAHGLQQAADWIEPAAFEIILRRAGHPDQVLALTRRHWQHAAAVGGAPLSIMRADGYDGFVDPGARMTREEAAKLVDGLIDGVTADVEADGEGYGDDTLAARDALVTLIAGPAGGDERSAYAEPVTYRRVVDVELPECDVEPEQTEGIELLAGAWPTDPDVRAAEEAAAREAFPVGRRVRWADGDTEREGTVRMIYPGGRGLWVTDSAGFGHTVAPSAAVLVDDRQAEHDAAGQPGECDPDVGHEHDPLQAAPSSLSAAPDEWVVEESATIVDEQPVRGREQAWAEIFSTIDGGTDPEQVFVFTFGGGHEDPQTGESLNNRYVVIVADDRQTADATMFDRYVDEWAFGYSLDAAVDMIAKFPEMRQVRLADELPVTNLRKLQLGPNGYTLLGENGTTLFRMTWLRSSTPGAAGDVRAENELPGVAHAFDEFGSVEAADAAARFLLQRWMRLTLGVRRSVRIVA
jgi:hypothetical protein